MWRYCLILLLTITFSSQGWGGWSIGCQMLTVNMEIESSQITPSIMDCHQVDQSNECSQCSIHCSTTPLLSTLTLSFVSLPNQFAISYQPSSPPIIPTRILRPPRLSV